MRKKASPEEAIREHLVGFIEDFAVAASLGAWDAAEHALGAALGLAEVEPDVAEEVGKE